MLGVIFPSATPDDFTKANEPVPIVRLGPATVIEGTVVSVDELTP